MRLPSPTLKNILLLAGTQEARSLAGALAADPGFTVTASLAGVTRAPLPLDVPVRSGGFGGVEGLRRALREMRIDAVVDATHPFAEQMSDHARQACAAEGVALLRLERPAWQPRPGDDWRMARDLSEAARMIPAGAHALLAVGRQELALFAQRRDITCLMRMIEPPAPDAALPPGDILLGRPEADIAAEVALLRHHRIDVIVAKNAGGKASGAKIAAAREMRIPVVMVARPAGGGGEIATVADVEAALAWLRDDHAG